MEEFKSGSRSGGHTVLFQLHSVVINYARKIDIHPSEDINATRGDTFIIGVRCQKDRVGNFEIKLNCSSSPPEHIDVLRDGAPLDLSIRHDSYTYLRVPVDVNRAGKVSCIELHAL